MASEKPALATNAVQNLKLASEVGGVGQGTETARGLGVPRDRNPFHGYRGVLHEKSLLTLQAGLKPSGLQHGLQTIPKDMASEVLGTQPGEGISGELVAVVSAGRAGRRRLEALGHRLAVVEKDDRTGPATGE